MLPYNLLKACQNLNIYLSLLIYLKIFLEVDPYHSCVQNYMFSQKFCCNQIIVSLAAFLVPKQKVRSYPTTPSPLPPCHGGLSSTRCSVLRQPALSLLCLALLSFSTIYTIQTKAKMHIYVHKYMCEYIVCVFVCVSTCSHVSAYM